MSNDVKVVTQGSVSRFFLCGIIVRFLEHAVAGNR
jgi:hypothetical protein